MDVPELRSFLERENERLLETLPGLSGENVALAQSVKLSEEVGELDKAVLSAEGLQRERVEPDSTTVEDELADVIITALLLGETLDIDVEAALSRKIETIDSRYE